MVGTVLAYTWTRGRVERLSITSIPNGGTHAFPKSDAQSSALYRSRPYSTVCRLRRRRRRRGRCHQGRSPALPERHHVDQRSGGQGRHHSGDQRDQRRRRTARQADRADHRGRRFRLAHVRRKGTQADRARRGRGGVRLLDVGEPQGRAAGVRGPRPPAVLSGPVRGPGSFQEHHLHRRRPQPADHAGGLLAVAGEGHRFLPARFRLRVFRAPPTRSSRFSSRRKAATPWPRSTPRSATPSTPP